MNSKVKQNIHTYVCVSSYDLMVWNKILWAKILTSQANALILDVSLFGANAFVFKANLAAADVTVKVFFTFARWGWVDECMCMHVNYGEHGEISHNQHDGSGLSFCCLIWPKSFACSRLIIRRLLLLESVSLALEVGQRQPCWRRRVWMWWLWWLWWWCW